MKACGGAIQTTVNNMTDEVLGMCELFEEEQIGGERYAVILGHCTKIILLIRWNLPLYNMGTIFDVVIKETKEFEGVEFDGNREVMCLSLSLSGI